MYAVLPVPVGPTKQKFFPCVTSVSMRNVYRMVSTVGTMMDEYAASSPIGTSSVRSTHRRHVPDGLSKQKS